MSPRKKSCLPVFLTIILFLLIVVTVVVIVRIPKDAASTFGQPADSLSYFDRLSLSINLLSHQEELLLPLNSAGSLTRFTIEPEQRVADIASHMQQIGLIPDAGIWVDYLVYRGFDVTLMAGTYRLSPANSPIQIADSMQNPSSQEVVFSILPGWRLEEIAASLPTSGLAIMPEEFLSATTEGNPSFLDTRLPGDLSSLEGYLMPGQYPVTRGTTLDELLGSLISGFFSSTTDSILDDFTDQGLSLDQAVILASIVQREAQVADEMPVIASVFINRLAAGMRLESDPTVQYALGFDPVSNSWWKVPLNANDLSFNSAYNTYLVAGLPPAPICNPGTEALQAIAQPASTGYYFFRALCDGSGRHAFADTYELHLANACD